jgi:hypothetical protein
MAAAAMAQHQQAERRDQRRERPQSQTDRKMPHPEIGDDPVGTPEHAQVLEDILRIHSSASSA